MTLGAEPDPSATLAWCTSKWSARPCDVCILAETEAFSTSLGEAKKACSTSAMKRFLTTPEVSDNELARTEREARFEGINR